MLNETVFSNDSLPIENVLSRGRSNKYNIQTLLCRFKSMVSLKDWLPIETVDNKGRSTFTHDNGSYPPTSAKKWNRMKNLLQRALTVEGDPIS